MLIDAHAHFQRPDELPARRGVCTLFCGTNPETAAQALALRGDGRMASCGLHPWHADRFTVAEMLPYIEQSAALGEIGLDSVWTNVDLDVQRRAFRAQLDLAQRLGMPVILHTKGMEAEIAEAIMPFTVPKLVHWYSCGDHLEKYLVQDCYFTVGPDHRTNPAVQAVLRGVPSDRIMTETDGLEAVAWALNREVAAADIKAVIEGELRAIARVHGITVFEAEDRVEENLARFLEGRNNGGGIGQV